MTDPAKPIEGTDINSERKLHQSDSREAQMEFSFAYGWVYALCWFLSFLVVVSRHLKELLSLLVELGTQRQFIKREVLASMSVYFLD